MQHIITVIPIHFINKIKISLIKLSKFQFMLLKEKRLKKLKYQFKLSQFQFTLLKEEQLTTIGAYYRPDEFQFTLLREKRKGLDRKEFYYWHLNSHSSHREWLWHKRWIHRLHYLIFNTTFQFTLPIWGMAMQNFFQKIISISIHTPRMGSDT